MSQSLKSQVDDLYQNVTVLEKGAIGFTGEMLTGQELTGDGIEELKSNLISAIEWYSELIKLLEESTDHYWDVFHTLQHVIFRLHLRSLRCTLKTQFLV